MEVGFPVAGNAVEELLLEACYNLLDHVRQSGDGVIEHGSYQMNGSHGAVSLLVWKANNHQTTYGVLRCALTCVVLWMREHEMSTANFNIYDGANQVGNAAIQQGPV